MLESSCPSVRARTTISLPLCGFDTAGAITLLAFFFSIEERTPTVAGDFELFQSDKRRSLLECSALRGKDQKLSLRRKSVFHTGNEH